jgi:hypothetical protein
MNIIMPSTPFGYSVFCDDLRQEVTGKLIYIGVYVSDMVIGHVANAGQAGVPPFPFVLPSLVIVVKYSERRNESTEPVVLKIFLPTRDDPFVTASIDVDGMRSVPTRVDSGPAEDQLVSSTIPFRLVGVPIEGEGLTRVRAYRGEDEIRLGTLPVKIASMQGAVPTTAQPSTAESNPEKWAKF